MEKQINALLNIKLFSLRRNYLSDLTLQQLKDVLYHTKWVVYVPDRLSLIAKDIDSLTINDIADYLTNKGTNIDFQLDEDKDIFFDEM